MADLSVVKSWALPQFDPTPEEARMLAEIRARESSGDYAARNPKPGSTAAGAYQFTSSPVSPTWQLATKGTGAPVYSSAAEAPQAVQDANALYMLRKHGPNATITWAASGPYNQPAPASAETPDKPAASLSVVKSWPLPQQPAAADDMPAITIGKPLAAPKTYGEIRTPSPFPGPRQTPPPAEKTVGGFIENAFTSTGNLIDALASPILRPKETLQGITALGQAMSEKSGFAPVMGQSHLEALDAIGDLYKQRYGSWQGFKDAAYKDPAGIAADLLTVVDGLGLGFQAANDFAKVAGLSDVAANAVSKAVTAAKGAAIGTVKAIPRVPAGMVKGALAGEVLSPERWPQLAGLGGLNELRKGAAAGKKLALDARAKAITEAFEAEQQARAAEVARIRERLEAIGIPAKPGSNRTGWTGTGDVSSPFPRGGGGGTPAPAATAPTFSAQMIAGAKKAGDFTPEETARAAAILENVEPTTSPAAAPAAPKPAAADIAAQMRAEMEKSGTIAPGEALAPDVAEPDIAAVARQSETAPTPLKQEIVNSANYARYLRKQGWTAADAQKMTAAERETLAKGFGNEAPSDAAWERTLFQMRRVEKSGYEYGVPVTKTTTPAEASAKFEQARKGPAKATAPTPATDLETQLADSLAGKRAAPPPEGPRALTAAEERVEAYAQHFAPDTENITSKTLDDLPKSTNALLQLEALGRRLGIKGRPASLDEVQQIVDRVRQLRGEGAARKAK